MPALKKVKLPNNTTVDINDARVVSDGIAYKGDELGEVTYEAEGVVVDLSDYQRKLESGVNIKTVNNQSLLGSGNIAISSGEANVIESVSFNGTTAPITNKNAAITATLDNISDGSTRKLSNYVTFNTAQTITGTKSFAETKWNLSGNENNATTNKYWDNSTYYKTDDSAVLFNNASIRNAIRFRWYADYFDIGILRSNASPAKGFAIGKENSAHTHVLDWFRVEDTGAYVLGNVVYHAGNISPIETVKVGGTALTKDANNAVDITYAPRLNSAVISSTGGDVNNAVDNQETLRYYTIGRTALNAFPAINNANGLLSIGTYGNDYAQQIGFSSDNKLYYRRKNAGVWNTKWEEIYSTASDINTSNLIEPNSATTTLTSQSLVDTMSGNKLALLPAEQVIIETTTDGGTTWVSAGVSDASKKNLFLGNSQNTSINIPKIDNVKNKLCGVRITITAMKYNVPDGTSETNKYQYWNSTYANATERYCSLNGMYIWCSSNSDRIRTEVFGATGANPNNWVRLSAGTSYMTGWAGGNYLRIFKNAFGGGTNQTGNYWNYRIVCFTDGVNGGDLSTSFTTSQQTIHRICGYGPDAWTVPNNFFGTGHIYSWDSDGTAYFPAGVYPETNNVGNLGSSAKRWNNICGTNLNLNGTATGITNLRASGDATINGIITTKEGVKIAPDSNSRLRLVTEANKAYIQAGTSSENNGSLSICGYGNTYGEQATINFNTITLDGNVSIGTSYSPRWLTTYGTVTGSSFVKSGGTSSQFLKADGSSDSTVYAPKSYVDDMLGDVESLINAL